MAADRVELDSTTLGAMASGAPNGATGKANAADATQVLAAARATRRSISLLNESTTQDVRWGYGTASRTTGMLLPAGRSISIETKAAIAIINVADGQTPAVSYGEDYD